MSRLTDTPLKVTPSAASGHDVSTNAVEWEFGDRVQFIAETTAEDTAFAGVTLHDSTAWAGLQLEVHASIVLSETAVHIPIGHIRLHGQNSGNGGPTNYLLPYPVSGIPIGSSVWLRYRAKGTTERTWPCTLHYYEDLDSDQAIPYTTALLTSYPAGADSVVITTTTWDDDSVWGEFSPAVGEGSYVFAVASADPGSGVDAEFDIGTGAPSLEMPLTSIRYGAYEQEGRLNFVNLPGLMPVTTGHRLVGCLRTSGSGGASVPVALLGYAGPLEAVPPEPPPVDGGVIGPLLFITMSFRPPVA